MTPCSLLEMLRRSWETKCLSFFNFFYLVVRRSLTGLLYDSRKRILSRGNWSTWRKPAKFRLVHHKSHMTRSAVVGNRRLTAWVTARPTKPQSFAPCLNGLRWKHFILLFQGRRLSEVRWNFAIFLAMDFWMEFWTVSSGIWAILLEHLHVALEMLEVGICSSL
jgi:hypothetical protein